MTLTTGDVYYDPYDFEIDADPHPVWKRMRDEAPHYYNEKYDFYALSRFADVEPALVDWETYRSGRGSVLELIKANVEMPPGIILFEDPPIHDLHRGLLSRVFTPKKMNAIEPKVREFCARSLDPLVNAGGFDFIADLGAQMPMRTIGFLLGIPEDDQEAIRDRLDEGLRLHEDGTPRRGTTDAADGEVCSFIPHAIEELLRYEAPSPVQSRYVARDVEVHGHTVPEGSVMVLLNGSANRDERHFPDADRFDIHRETGHHLSFGYGLHFCLGAALARLEGRVALDEVLRRFPEWDVDWEHAKMARTSTVRGWESLPVRTGTA